MSRRAGQVNACVVEPEPPKHLTVSVLQRAEGGGWMGGVSRAFESTGSVGVSNLSLAICSVTSR